MHRLIEMYVSGVLDNVGAIGCTFPFGRIRLLVGHRTLTAEGWDRYPYASRTLDGWDVGLEAAIV